LTKIITHGIIRARGKDGDPKMTETAYLYQYFLEHSSVKNNTPVKGVKKVEKPEKEQEVKHNGNHTRQHD
jgi:hypothetical protein